MSNNLVNSFLNTVYEKLDFNTENLSQVENYLFLSQEKQYVEKGQWLTLCNYLNNTYSFTIDKVFFVENNPFIIFISTNIESDKIHEVYNQIWNMARPRFLFLANPVRLEVYDLAGKPVKDINELTPLATVTSIQQIATKLKKYRREQIETGKVFGDEKFDTPNYSSNISLINDLKIVREKLFDIGLNNSKLKYAHALIGRSIFIRYLEDRKIIKYNYFQKVANTNPRWKTILDKKLDRDFFREDMAYTLFPRVLTDHDFTYALFDQLAKDFNGDLFPTDNEEKKAVTGNHLSLLQDFLIGNVKEQKNIFLWAYKFDIIPIELISNIYEEFYHFENRFDTKTKKLKDSKGTYYTPATLVEFVLSKVLTSEQLKNKPRVMDTACGSGIFLVEAFRRMVRYELFNRRKEFLSFEELLNILENQIAGIELNEEAIKITAFSLYLALLNYQKPPDIEKKLQEGKRLPMLICSNKKQTKKTYFDILLNANTFNIENLNVDRNIRDKFLSNCADIVIGNPPWGAPSQKDTEARKELRIVEDWCLKNQKPISDKELSQAFLWRAIDLLKPDGIAGMLVSYGVLFKNSKTAINFKNKLLNSITLQNVTNFIHVRDVFFTKGISPFLSLVLKKQIPSSESYIQYWTAKRTKIIEKSKCVVLDYNDFKLIKYSDITNSIWKIFYFGNYRDYSLINTLRVYNKLEKLVDIKHTGRGFEKGKRYEAKWLSDYKVLDKSFLKDRYTPLLTDEKLKNVSKDPPTSINRRGKSPQLYEGWRILFKTGIIQKSDTKGQIIIRLEKEKFSYELYFICIKLVNNNLFNLKLLLGIFWSSLARYYFFITTSLWGVWNDHIYFDEILRFPIIIPKDETEQTKDIIKIVDKLRNIEFIENSQQNNQTLTLFEKINYELPTQLELEKQLDNAIFDLYMLTEAQRDLISDRCKYDIDHFYHGTNSIAVKPVELPYYRYGILSSIRQKNKTSELENYIQIFLNSWNEYLEVNEEFNWQYFLSGDKEMLALIFTLQEKGKKIEYKYPNDYENGWKDVLNKLKQATQIEYSKRIYIEGIVIVVTKEQIFVIKRNEKRLWTSSSARMDAESTLVKAMNTEY